MDFDEKGFLGTTIIEFSNSVYKKHSDFFDTCYRINELGQEIKFKFEIHKEDIQESLAAPLFIRILNGFQAVISLAKLGLVFDAKVVLRGALEALFLLKAVCENEKFSKEYIQTDKLRRLKWMELAHANKHSIFNSAREYATPDIIKTLKTEIAKYKIKKFSTEDVAKKAKLAMMYDTDYRLLSAEVHSIPFAIGTYYFVDRNKETDELPWGPSDSDIEYVLFVAIRIVFISLVSTARLFGIEADYEKRLEEIDQTLTRLASMLKFHKHG